MKLGEDHHVFLLAADANGQLRAQQKFVQVGSMLGDTLLIQSGVEAGDQVATSGSFKLRDSVLVSVDNDDRTALNSHSRP